MPNLKIKSPLKDRPLRNPGESLANQLNDFLIDEVLLNCIVVAIAIVLIALEWYRFYFNPPPSPWTMTIIGLIVICYSLTKIYLGFKKARKLKLGRDGEKVVGQYLELLREQGAKIFHDIPGKDFNVDHVVICKNGIFVIETKTYSKPNKGDARILFKGDSICLMGKTSVREIIQVKAASSWLKDLIEQSTGHKLLVKPVLVFPGWFIETATESKNSEVWVLNPRSLPTFISNSKEQLTDELIRMTSFHLSRYIRTFEEKI